MKKLPSTLLFLAAAVLTVGCKEGSTKVVDGGRIEQPKPETVVLTEAQRTKIMEQLDGNWYRECRSISTNDYGQYAYSFSDSGEFEGSFQVYSDANCTQTKSDSNNSLQGGTYQITDQQLTSNGTYTTGMDVFLTRLDKWYFISFQISNGQLFLSSDFEESVESRDPNVDYNDPYQPN